MDLIKKINKGKSVWEVLPTFSITDLEKVIKLSADSYYNEAVSLLSDEIFDLLVDQLKRRAPNSKVLKQIGAPVIVTTVTKGKKTELPYYMGSMNKLKTDKEINAWTDEYGGPYIISDKLDGISCLLTNSSDNKIRLYSRGDGTYGQDITHLLNFINLNSKALNNTELAIRGELIMTKDAFDQYVDIMSNARNMVGGIVNSKAESINKKHAADVDFISYEIIKPKLKPSDQLRQLRRWNFDVVHHDTYYDINQTILDNILQKRKKRSEYEIDGIIVTDNQIHERNTEGNPSYSFAYKGVNPTIEVEVLAVKWKPSKDGVLVPVVHFEKTRVGGVDLAYATGFNAKFIVDNKIGVGAIINVIRSGDVIPYITNVIKGVKPSLPTKYEYVWDKTETNIVLIDPEIDETVIVQRLTKFMRQIGVDNLSEGLVKRLVTAGHDTIPKIMQLTVDDFLDLEGFQETLANKLHRNLNTALNNLDELKLMVASNIFGRGFGFRKIKKILNVYPYIAQDYVKRDRTKWENNLLAIEGFADISVGEFLDSMPRYQKIRAQVARIRTIKPYVSNGTVGADDFAGAVIVFTGFRNKQWEKYIEEQGGKVSTSVSKNTTLLVYKDGDSTSRKYLTAKKLRIEMISQTEFAQKFGF